MAYVSKEEFLKLKERSSTPRQSFQNGTAERIGFLKLENDGDEAIIRLVYDDVDRIIKDLITCHNVNLDGKFRRISCLRQPSEPFSLCPLCESGSKSNRRLYVRMLQYFRDPNTGEVTYKPVIFDRPDFFVDKLIDFMSEYGDLSNVVLKIKRRGAKGYQRTDYDLLYCNQSIYNEELYPKDFSAFTNYNIIGIGGSVFDMDANAMRERINKGSITFEKVEKTSKTNYASQSNQVESESKQPQFEQIQNYSSPVRRVSYQ